MKKVFDFFKTPVGMFIAAVVVIGIIMIIINWKKIFPNSANDSGMRKKSKIKIITSKNDIISRFKDTNEIKQFQRYFKLPVTGILDEKTINSLYVALKWNICCPGCSAHDCHNGNCNC